MYVYKDPCTKMLTSAMHERQEPEVIQIQSAEQRIMKPLATKQEYEKENFIYDSIFIKLKTGILLCSKLMYVYFRHTHNGDDTFF